MFARYFVELPIEPELATGALTHDPGGWLPGFAKRANHRGESLLAEVGLGEDVRIARTVVVELREPVHMESKTLLPLRWTASGPGGLLPSLDADLEVAPLGNNRTQLAISARYTPPLGPLGRVIDRAVLSRVAEATLKDFLDRIATAIIAKVARDREPQVPAESPSPSAG